MAGKASLEETGPAAHHVSQQELQLAPQNAAATLTVDVIIGLAEPTKQVFTDPFSVPVNIRLCRRSPSNSWQRLLALPCNHIIRSPHNSKPSKVCTGTESDRKKTKSRGKTVWDDNPDKDFGELNSSTDLERAGLTHSTLHDHIGEGSVREVHGCLFGERRAILFHACADEMLLCCSKQHLPSCHRKSQQTSRLQADRRPAQTVRVCLLKLNDHGDFMRTPRRTAEQKLDV